jgi:4-amino-4-deoxy-L-arabinose transferase-like glycosyltransferase
MPSADASEERVNIFGIVRVKFELIAISCIFIAVLALDLNAAFHGGGQGQDFYAHRRLTAQVVSDPLTWFSQSRRRVDPPLYYFISAAVLRLAGPDNWLVALSVVNVFFNVSALLVLYFISRLLLQSVLLRICVLCFVGFLPAFVIPSVVIAADAPCQLLCLLMVYFIGLAVLRKISLRFGLIGCITAAVLCVVCKFISVALIAAFLATLLLAVLSKQLRLRQAILGAALFLTATVPLELFLLLQSPEGVAISFAGTEASRQLHLKKLQLRSVLFFRSGDLQLLDAPSHWPMTQNPKTSSPSFWNFNRYSYPALLCLGTFTDVQNLFQSKTGLDREPKEPYKGGALVGKRSKLNQRLMKISMRIGVPIFICILFSLPIFCLDSLIRLFRQRSARDLIWLSAFLIGAAWLSFMVCLIPLTLGAYLGGYYLNRLVVPSLMICSLLFFAGLDRSPVFRQRYVASTLLCLVIAQSLLHFTFLWMR